MKKILVIGGTGFLGFHIIKEAKKRNWDITSVSKNKPLKKRFHTRVNYKFANIENYNSLKKIITKNFDYVVNAGGYGNHPDFNVRGEKLFKSHFFGLVNLVELLSEKKIKKFVQIGSSMEYGNIKSPFRETDKCYPKTPYAVAKFTCTKFLQNINKINGFPVTILRLFLVYGPCQDINRLIPQVILNSLKNKKFPTTAGNQYCDFSFVDDVVNAIFITFTSKNTNGKIFNIGSGQPVKIKHMIKRLCNLIGKGKPMFGKLKYRKQVNKKLLPVVYSAKKQLKWISKIPLSKGLKLTINSYK